MHEGSGGRRFVTVHEVSAMLSIPESTLRDWRLKRIGPPSVKLGGLVRYDLHDVEAWIEAEREGIEPRSRDRLEEQRRRRGLA